MYSIENQIQIAATPARALVALTTSDGLRGWWTASTDCDVARREATFRFERQAGTMAATFRIDRADERGVAMTCIGEQNNAEWLGTKLEFGLATVDGGTRVAKFGPDDKFIMDWGQPPADPKNPGPNEWNTVHSIAISADRKLFVVDRGHARMQVFDENGKFLDMWPLRSPDWPASQNTLMVNHFIEDKGFIWVGDAPTARILKFDQQGNFLYSWGAPGPQPGRLGCSHGMTTDQLGNLYLADCFNGRVQKFEPIANANPDRIAGQILRTWDTWKKN